MSARLLSAISFALVCVVAAFACVAAQTEDGALCPGLGLITCPDGSCAQSGAECRQPQRREDRRDDTPTGENRGPIAVCSSRGLVSCSDGSCAPSASRCPRRPPRDPQPTEQDGELPCASLGLSTCSDGSCAPDPQECY